MSAETKPESPAAMLRQAARLMREHAEAATKGPWRAVAGTWSGETFAAVVAPEGDPANAETWLMATGRGSICQEADAKHAVFWHPGVSLAVADLLESAAGRIEENNVFGAKALVSYAVDVARIYLGEQP